MLARAPSAAPITITWTEPDDCLTRCDWTCAMAVERNSDGAIESFRVADVENCVAYPCGSKQGARVAIGELLQRDLCSHVAHAMNEHAWRRQEVFALIEAAEAEERKASAEQQAERDFEEQRLAMARLSWANRPKFVPCEIGVLR